MNKIKNYILNHFRRYRNIYLAIFIIFFIGIIFGTILVSTLSTEAKKSVIEYLNSFFTSIEKNETTDHWKVLQNSLIGNFLYLLSIFILGLSVVGLPIILLLIFLKGFTLGFSTGIFIYYYNAKGILGILLSVYPHNIFSSLAIIIMGMYAILFSMRVIYNIMKKKSVNYNALLAQYVKVFLFTSLLMISASLIEVYIMPELSRWFIELK